VLRLIPGAGRALIERLRAAAFMADSSGYDATPPPADLDARVAPSSVCCRVARRADALIVADGPRRVRHQIAEIVEGARRAVARRIGCGYISSSDEPSIPQATEILF